MAAMVSNAWATESKRGREVQEKKARLTAGLGARGLLGEEKEAEERPR
jgi:hypothetical protein